MGHYNTTCTFKEIPWYHLWTSQMFCQDRHWKQINSDRHLVEGSTIIKPDWVWGGGSGGGAERDLTALGLYFFSPEDSGRDCGRGKSLRYKICHLTGELYYLSLQRNSSLNLISVSIAWTIWSSFEEHLSFLISLFPDPWAWEGIFLTFFRVQRAYWTTDTQYLFFNIISLYTTPEHICFYNI